MGLGQSELFDVQKAGVVPPAQSRTVSQAVDHVSHTTVSAMSLTKWVRPCVMLVGFQNMHTQHSIVQWGHVAHVLLVQTSTSIVSAGQQALRKWAHSPYEFILIGVGCDVAILCACGRVFAPINHF
jgi:hypothetical protein